MQNRIVLGGSSPLTRGTLPPKENPLFSGRFIPAYAGNSKNMESIWEVDAVHPRLRGELFYVLTSKTEITGSSPLTRGTPDADVTAAGISRFIPAYAGNSARSACANGPRAVHPRLRGELARNSLVIISTYRFIPAYAGNSWTRPRLICTSAVHPRLRGELFQKRCRRHRAGGSSPLTRGTQNRVNQRSPFLWFIPAYAGNSTRCAMAQIERPVHPRLRGELT